MDIELSVAHWACGKINCDCDEQYEQAREEELMHALDE